MGDSRILLVSHPFSANTQVAMPIMNGIEKLLGVRSEPHTCGGLTIGLTIHLRKQMAAVPIAPSPVT